MFYSDALKVSIIKYKLKNHFIYMESVIWEQHVVWDTTVIAFSSKL